MALIRLDFACGHEVEVDGEAQPTCACGETRIVRVHAPAPRFVGHARGPCADYRDLPAQAVTLNGEPDGV